MLPRILAVDDDPVMRRLFRALFPANLYQLVVFSDGQEAWEYLQNSQVDLVIADIAMPRMDGKELCEKIRGVPSLVSLPLILLTGRLFDLTTEYVTRINVAAVVGKPFSPAALKLLASNLTQPASVGA